MKFIVDYLKYPQWGRQNRWRKAIWNMMARVGLTGIHALPMSRRWVEIHRRRMPLAGLDPALSGLKLVQISDLHYSPVVWERYLVQFVAWVNGIQPDIVTVTGDLITGGYRFAHRVATILSHFRATQSVICIFGNHDYSIYGKNGSEEGSRRADYLEKCLRHRGIVVLRNASWRLPAQDGGRSLTIVGLDDDWSGHLDADRAFADVPPDEPVVCLNHNPANCLSLLDHPWQWMLAGHTHGRQLATSALGRALFSHRRRQFTHGYYHVHGRHLYVNRGLSYGQRVLKWCRPEITVFNLEAR